MRHLAAAVVAQANGRNEVVITNPQMAQLLDCDVRTVSSKLLKLRKCVVIGDGRQLRLCGLDTHVWGVFLVTGLDKVFEFADDLSMGLASVQINSNS